MRFFGKKIKKNIVVDERNDFTAKSAITEIYWNERGQKIFFDFDDAEKINLAINTVPELSSILNYLAKSLSTGEYQVKSNNEVIDNPLTELLNNPHPFFNKTDFLQQIAVSLMAYGRCHIYIGAPLLRDNAKSLYLLPTHKTKIKLKDIRFNNIIELEDFNNIVDKYETVVNGKVVDIDPLKVLTIKSNTVANFESGYLNFKSPLKPLENALKVTPAIYDTMQNLMNNQGMKGFAVNKSSGEFGTVRIGDEDKKNIQEAFRGYGTKSGQNQIAFVNHDVDYIQVSAIIKDLLLPEQQKMIKTILADVLGFDTAILNNDSANKYANYNEARKSLFTEIIIPLSNVITEGLTSYLFKFKSLTIKLDYSHLEIFSEDKKTKSEAVGVESTFIINLNKSVSLGEMTKENAVLFLISNGYDEEIAKKLIK